MRVGVDARHLTAARGVARYTRDLLRALAAGFPEDEWRAFVPGHGAIPALPDGVEPVRHRLPGRVLFASGAVAGRPRLDRLLGGVDVLWVPAPAPLAVSPDVPLVLTVHDLSFERRPGDFTPYERLWHRLARPRALAARADAVVCVSDAVRSDLAEAWDVEATVVTPAPLRATPGVAGPGAPALPTGAGLPGARAAGAGLPGARAAGAGLPGARRAGADLPGAHPPGAGLPGARAARAGLPGARRAGAGAAEQAGGAPAAPYFLYVGALEPRKAPDVLAAAFARARAGGLRADLVVVGDGRTPIGGPGIRRARGATDDGSLARLYADALALVAPSWIEGFGLPPVEAAALGTPSVVTDLAVFAETLGDGALRVSPGDVAALADALLRIESDEALRSQLAEAAVAAAGRYSWDRSAEALHATLARVAGGDSATRNTERRVAEIRTGA